MDDRPVDAASLLEDSPTDRDGEVKLYVRTAYPGNIIVHDGPRPQPPNREIDIIIQGREPFRLGEDVPAIPPPVFLENKGYGDSLSVERFEGCLGWTQNWREANPGEPCCLTIISWHRPVKVFRMARDAGVAISEAVPGIHHYPGLFPTYIMVLNERPDDAISVPLKVALGPARALKAGWLVDHVGYYESRLESRYVVDAMLRRFPKEVLKMAEDVLEKEARAKLKKLERRSPLYRVGREDGLKRGMKKGRVEGLEDGRMEGLASAVQALSDGGMDEADIARWLNLDLEKVRALLR